MNSSKPVSQDEKSPEKGQQQQQQSGQQQKQHQPPFSELTISSAKKIYNMYYTTSRSNVKLFLNSSPSTKCTYYGQCTVLTTKPQLQLRAGDSKSAPMVAFAKLHLTKRNVLLGCGDYQKDSEESLVWEEMRRDRFRLVRSDYEFETSVGNDAGTRRTYGWRVEKSMVKTVYKCVDDEGQVVANLLSGGMANWQKGGELEVVEGLEEKLEQMLIVSALAIWVAEAGWSVFKGYKSGGSGSSQEGGGNGGGH